MTWRPEGWKNPYEKTMRPPTTKPAMHRAYENGADAMLEMLKKMGYRLTGESIIPAYGDYPEIHLLSAGLKGWLIIIEEETDGVET